MASGTLVPNVLWHSRAHALLLNPCRRVARYAAEESGTETPDAGRPHMGLCDFVNYAVRIPRLPNLVRTMVIGNVLARIGHALGQRTM